MSDFVLKLFFTSVFANTVVCGVLAIAFDSAGPLWVLLAGVVVFALTAVWST